MSTKLDVGTGHTLIRLARPNGQWQTPIALKCGRTVKMTTQRIKMTTQRIKMTTKRTKMTTQTTKEELTRWTAHLGRTGRTICSLLLAVWWHNFRPLSLRGQNQNGSVQILRTRVQTALIFSVSPFMQYCTAIKFSVSRFMQYCTAIKFSVSRFMQYCTAIKFSVSRFMQYCTAIKFSDVKTGVKG